MSNTLLNQAVTSGLKVSQDVGGTGLKGLVIGNSSNLQATVVMQNAGVSRTLYPYTVDFFESPHDASGHPKAWSGNLMITFAVGTPDANAYVQVDSIGLNEPFRNTYPIPLTRGSISTTVAGTNTLDNSGNPINTEVITIGTPTTPKLWDVFNDHFVVSVEQSGVAHQVLKGQTSGNPLQIGKNGDTTEVVGTLVIDQNETIAGTETVTGGTTLNGSLTANSTTTITTGAKGTLHLGQLSTGDTIDTDGNAALYLKAPTGQAVTFQINGVTTASATANGIKGTNGQSITGISGFGVGAGATVTVNHNLGTTPNGAVVTQQTAAGSQTQGVSSINSTQLTVTNGSSAAAWGMAFKGS